MEKDRARIAGGAHPQVTPLVSPTTPSVNEVYGGEVGELSHQFPVGQRSLRWGRRRAKSPVPGGRASAVGPANIPVLSTTPVLSTPASPTPLDEADTGVSVRTPEVRELMNEVDRLRAELLQYRTLVRNLAESPSEPEPEREEDDFNPSRLADTGPKATLLTSGIISTRGWPSWECPACTPQTPTPNSCGT
jgi:hypothetical protein